MRIDEYEVIRLIDLLGLTQEQCAARWTCPARPSRGFTTAPAEKLLMLSSMESASHRRRPHTTL